MTTIWVVGGSCLLAIAPYLYKRARLSWIEFREKRYVKKARIMPELVSESERRLLTTGLGRKRGERAIAYAQYANNEKANLKRIQLNEKAEANFSAMQTCPRCETLDVHWLEVTQTYFQGGEWLGRLSRTCKHCGYSWQLNDTWKYGKAV